jgi:Ca2+-binding RTX toxin-like protein
MIATRQLIASSTLLLAALGVTAVPLSADAAVDTCQGKVATIVQSTGTVNGTDGDDVIVAGSGDPFDPVTTVLAGAGDDTVCVVGGGVDVFDGGSGVDSIVLRGDNDGEGLPTVIDFEHLDIRVNFYLGELYLEWTEVPSELMGTVVADYRAGARVSKVLDNPTVHLAAPENSTYGLRVDLRSRQVSLGEGLSFALTGVNDVYMNAHKIRAFGNDNRNYLILSGCDVVARGGDGNDRLWASDRKGDRRCPGVRLLGQRGPDKLDGTKRNDVLIGGPDPDLAEGGRGRDRCVAEHKTSCER